VTKHLSVVFQLWCGILASMAVHIKDIWCHCW